MTERQVGLLRFAFLAGAIADGAAAVFMVFPPIGGALWGIRDASVSFRFAMGFGAAPMLGWTALLIGASRRPVERRFVAALTVLVVWGLVLAEVFAVHAGVIDFSRMVPTWCLQAGLLFLYALAYHGTCTSRSCTS